MGVRFQHSLVVDDNETMRSVVSRMLAKMGLKVLAVENGEKGIDLFLNNRFDLVITDLTMPGMDGINLARQIKKIAPQTAIILMTGHHSGEVQPTVADNPVDHILFKPFSFAVFQDTLQKISDRKKFNFIHSPGRKKARARGADRRQESRTGCSQPIYFTTKKRIYQGTLKNYSRSGFFIETWDCLAEDEMIIAIVPCTDDGDARCKGRIIWCNAQGFGVKRLSGRSPGSSDQAA